MKTLCLSLCFAFFSPPADAGEFFVSASADQKPTGRDVGGLNWVRVFNNFRDGGWWMTHHWEISGMPGYNVAPMTEGLELDMSSRMRLAEYPETKDHGIERCPDGSFLHIYSLTVMNDGARAARYSEDWDILAEATIEEDAPERAHNDMPVICSEHLQGVAFTNHSDFKATLFELGPDATVTATHRLDVGAHISGAAFKYDEISNRYLMTANGEPGLQAIWINRDLTVDERVNFVPIPGLDRHFWPQALMRVGDYWLLGFLGVEYVGQYLAEDGDVYLAVLDDDFETLETIKVSQNDDGTGLGSARPSFARYSDQLLVAWDKAFEPRVSVVTLDLAAFGVEGEDSGFDPADDAGEGSPCDAEDVGDGDGDGSGGSGAVDNGEDDAPGGTASGDGDGNTDDDYDEDDAGEGIKADPCSDGCGCTQSPSSPRLGWLALVGLVALGRRRALDAD